MMPSRIQNEHGLLSCESEGCGRNDRPLYPRFGAAGRSYLICDICVVKAERRQELLDADDD